MKIRINRVEIFLLLELLLILPCDYLYSLSRMTSIFRAASYFAVLIEFLLLFVYRKKLKVYLTNWMILIYYVYQWGVTVLLHSEPYLHSLNFLATGLLLFLICVRYQSIYPYLFVKTLRSYFWIILLINLATIVMAPEGLSITYSRSGNMHINYFLGVDNQFGKYFFPGFAIIWFYEERFNKKNSFTTISALLMIFATYFITKSGTGLVLTIVLGFLYICYTLKLFRRLVSFKSLSIIVAVLTSSIIAGMGIMFNDNNFITRAVLAITGKNASFSGRVNIWATGVAKFLKRPIIGYGKTVGDYSITIGAKEIGAHNIFIQTLIEGGIVGIILFLLPIIYAGVKSEKVLMDDDKVRILYIGVFLTMCFFLMEKGTIAAVYLVSSIMTLYTMSLSNGQTSIR